MTIINSKNLTWEIKNENDGESIFLEGSKHEVLNMFNHMKSINEDFVLYCGNELIAK